MSNYASVSAVSLTQAIIDQDRLWTRAAIVDQLFNELARADVYSGPGRTAALENITSLVPGEPYSINDGTPAHPTALRFGPQTAPATPAVTLINVALFRDGWQEVFDALLGSLTQPAATADNVALFYGALVTAGAMIRNSIGFYNYRTFESEYQLTWT